MSLKEIASITGVSPSTVSRVLNGKGKGYASEEICKKIWDVAREICYIPNQSAQDLKQGKKLKEKAKKISIVFPRINRREMDPFFSELFQYIEENMLTQKCITDQVVFSENIDQEILRGCDGLVILGRCPNELLKKLKTVTPNIVGIWRNPTNFDVDEVICDGKKAASEAIRYLISLGHSRIGYIGDCSYESRYIGYCETLFSHNIPVNYNSIIQTHQTESEGYEAMKQLLSLGDTTAVLCANDITAVGALKALTLKNRTYPVSIISIDNIIQSQKTDPPLTTINIPKRSMAHIAISVLLDRINKGHIENIRTEFPCDIIYRDSCYYYKAI